MCSTISSATFAAPPKPPHCQPPPLSPPSQLPWRMATPAPPPPTRYPPLHSTPPVLHGTTPHLQATAACIEMHFTMAGRFPAIVSMAADCAICPTVVHWHLNICGVVAQVRALDARPLAAAAPATPPAPAQIPHMPVSAPSATIAPAHAAPSATPAPSAPAPVQPAQPVEPVSPSLYLPGI